MEIDKNYYARAAAAYVRGKITPQFRNAPVLNKPLDELDDYEMSEIIKLGKDMDLKMHLFKRKIELPRVHKVIGIIKGIQPKYLLDIGTGRGVFLWPLANAMPALKIECIDKYDYWVDQINFANLGGITNIRAYHIDVLKMRFPNDCFEVTTMLEVLEHIPDMQRAIDEVCRVTKEYVILSVPSKEDNNPEHIHLVDQETIKHLLREKSIRNIKYYYVPRHMIALIHLEHNE